MASAAKLAIGPVLGRALRAVEHYLPLFLSLAVCGFALTRLLLLAKTALFPPPVFSPFEPTSQQMMAGFLSMLESRAFLIPLAIFEAFAAGLIAHRLTTRWRREPVSLNADLAAVRRSAGALVVMGLIWQGLEVLPLLPEWFKAPPPPPAWLAGPFGIWIYMTVYWHPIQEAGFAAIALLWVWWCMAIPAIVTEGLGPIAAIRRSMDLARGRYLRLLALWAIYLGAGALIILAALAANGQAGAIPVKEIVNALRYILAMLFAATGAAAIYAEASGTIISPQNAKEPNTTTE